MRMLVADDDPVYRTLLVGLARHVGHDPLVACDGEEAWELYLHAQPRVVLTDWMMPNVTGVELTARIRAMQTDVRPMIIIVTSLSQRERVLEGFRAGADDYVAKPFDQEVFAARVRAATSAAQHAAEQEEAAHHKLVELCKAVIGRDSPELMDSLQALSRLYLEQRAYSKARAFLRRQEQIARMSGDLATLAHVRATLDEVRELEDDILPDAHGIEALV
jgi:DNA-binding response OmpR family regulator